LPDPLKENFNPLAGFVNICNRFYGKLEIVGKENGDLPWRWVTHPSRTLIHPGAYFIGR